MERPPKDRQLQDLRRAETPSDHRQAFQFPVPHHFSWAQREKGIFPADQFQWQSRDTNRTPSSPDVQNHQQPFNGFYHGCNGEVSSSPDAEAPQQLKSYFA
ncbi:hypothetical protein CRG98_049528 [Punica granatum]|uniref:Uncharacterized protein n=1 Tax=Punica granatum TaxID=22663 RepID=A0A2I0HEG3_PUNGR|nr:hypothetical protein CRG98_049528 [Punica granatum]